MQFEQMRWEDLEEDQQRQALAFVPEILAAPLHGAFKSCVRKEEEEDGDVFILGELYLSWFELFSHLFIHSSTHLLIELFTYLFIDSGASRRECAYFDDELVEFFQEYDQSVERGDGLVVLRPSTNRVEERSVESTTMLLVGDVVDDVRDSAWKEILIA